MELTRIGWDELRAALSEKRFRDLKETLNELPAVEVTEFLRGLSPAERVICFRLLNKEKAAEAFAQLEPEEALDFLRNFTDEEVRAIIGEMRDDDRTELFDELPAGVVKRLLALLRPEEREIANQLLNYPQGTAGHIMTTDFVDLKADMTAAQALEHIRRKEADKEMVYYLYITDAQRKLLGVLSLRQLILAEPDAKLFEIMREDVIYVSTLDDQETVVDVFQKYDLLAVPVVDKEQRLVGIITVDDILDVAQEEATEDIYYIGGGVSPAEPGYFRSSIQLVVQRRIAWLLVLLVTNTLTGTIIKHHTGMLQVAVVLAAFIPLLIGSGGNVGAQSSTVVVRGLAVREISRGDVASVVLREAGVGLLLGLALGTIVTAWAVWLQGDWHIAAAVGLSLVVISTLASITGTALPFLFAYFGLDPAMMTAPFITTIVDVLGVLVYFYIAGLILGI